MNIGKAIKEIRKKKGIQQGELAVAIGISQTSLSQIESGLKKPSTSSLNKISEALNVSEPFIYMMSYEEQDIPQHKKEIFKLLYPTVKSMILQITDDE